MTCGLSCLLLTAVSDFTTRGDEERSIFASFLRDRVEVGAVKLLRAHGGCLGVERR